MPTRRRRSWMVEMASRAPETTWLARARWASSVNLASSSSALARMIPSWLFSRWNTPESSGPETSMTLVVVGCGPTLGAAAEALVPVALGISRRIRLTPERVGEDAHRSACGPYVLNFAAGNPVVDRAAADADQLARPWNRHCFPIKQHDVFCHPRGPLV